MLAEFILLVSGWGSRPNSLLYISIGTGVIAATLLVLGFLQERKRHPADKSAKGSTLPSETLAFEDQVEADLKALEEGSDDIGAVPGGIQDEPVVSKAGPSGQWSGKAAGTGDGQTATVSSAGSGGTMLKDISQDANEGEKVKSETTQVPTQSNSVEPAAKEKKRGFGRFFGRSAKKSGSTDTQDAAAALNSSANETKPFPGVKLDGEPDSLPAQTESLGQGSSGESPQPSPAPVIPRAKAPAKPKPKSVAKPKPTVRPSAAKPPVKPKPSARPRPAAKPAPKPKSPAKPKAAAKPKSKPTKK